MHIAAKKFRQWQARALRSWIFIAGLTLPAWACAQAFGANSAPQPEMSPMEHAVIEEMNFARRQPAQYAQLLRDALRFYQGREVVIPGEMIQITQEGAAAVQEAIDFLERQQPLEPLTAAPGLAHAANDLIVQQGPAGTMGHQAPDGSNPRQRIERYGQWRGRMGENISYGPDGARKVVQQLIDDDGVPDRGHRANIFQPVFHETGVACGPHRVYGSMCAILYAADFIPAGARR